MKHGNGKNPTFKQKKFLTEHGLNYKKWLVTKDTSGSMVVMSKEAKTSRVINKSVEGMGKLVG